MKTKLKTKLYHVSADYVGGDLMSLYEMYRDEAYELYAQRWPDAGGMGSYHAHYVHLYERLDDAEMFSAEFGGSIYEVDVADLEEIEIDDLEFPHPMVRDRITSDRVSFLSESLR